MIISKMLGLPYPPECSPREYSNLKASFVRDREENCVPENLLSLGILSCASLRNICLAIAKKNGDKAAYALGRIRQ